MKRPTVHQSWPYQAAPSATRRAAPAIASRLVAKRRSALVGTATVTRLSTVVLMAWSARRGAVAGGAELAGGDGVQQRAQLGGTLAAERGGEARLRFGPALGRLAQPRGPGFGEVQFLAAAIGAPRGDGDQTLAL